MQKSSSDFLSPCCTPTFTGILFDLDGTLLDTALDFEYAIQQLASDLSLSSSIIPLPSITISRDFSIDSLRYAVNNGVEAIIKLAFNIEKNHPHYGLLSETFLSHYLKCLGQHVVLFPGILECLSQLNTAKIPWGIVTNKLQKFTLPLIEKLSILQQAQIVVSGDTLVHTKPHPAPLEYACKKMNMNPRHTLYVGDAQRDVQAAQAAHMPCVVATYGYISPQDQPYSWGANYYITHAEQLSALLFKL